MSTGVSLQVQNLITPQLPIAKIAIPTSGQTTSSLGVYVQISHTAERQMVLNGETRLTARFFIVFLARKVGNQRMMTVYNSLLHSTADNKQDVT
jgi:hypothetical protein